ncbi:MAG TPA: class I tRNA ligase family protein, partial [Thermoanaerobaculia bacterium]|nr:class I tRNA ligase family protein [Thermoanaerobaculia bacterium]
MLVELRAAGLLVSEEPYVHNVGHCQRSGVRIEPLVSTQWFCDVSGMAQQALAAVRDGRIELLPASWEKTWEHWLENIRPWCISRQLWWGHQIPAWYDPAGNVWVARSFEEAAALAGTEALRQDDDVLDTWFSSALWPFSTLGWPEATPDLAAFYPTDVLVTAFDILFFWVARMVMSGLHFTGEVPFRRVHLTGLVRDASGVKMSKTKGNVLDPADLVATYGADAVRFTLALLDAPGRDIPLDPERMAGYRAFGNKIWNATRFALGRIGDARVAPELDTAELAVPERWILSRLAAATAEVGEKFESFRFDEACQRLYHFFWGDLCDWYIELAKPALTGDAARPRVAEVLLTVLERALRLLHPVMPFLTEELWQRLPGHEAIHPETICLAPYPEPEPEWIAPEAEARMEALIAVVTRARALRLDLGLKPKERARLLLEGGDPETLAFLTGEAALIGSLAQLSAVEAGTAGPEALRDQAGGVAIAVVAEARAATPAEL